MKQLTILSSAELPNKTEIEVFEKSIGFKLPDSYKKFLMTQNPINTTESIFSKSTDEFWINDFHPFCKNDENSLQNVHNEIAYLFENKYLSFANDAGNWQFVISINEIDYGKVYFCRMDERLEEGLTFLTNDFEQFIDGLEEE